MNTKNTVLFLAIFGLLSLHPAKADDTSSILQQIDANTSDNANDGSTTASTVTASASPAHAEATPKPKKIKPAVSATHPAVVKFYSGTVKITSCDNQFAIGIDQKTGLNIACTPRFKGAYPGLLVRFDKNRILGEKDGMTAIACHAGSEDNGPYIPPPNAAQVVGGAIGVAGSILGALSSFHR